MSNSLLKKSLDLLEEDTKFGSYKISKSEKKKKKNKGLKKVETSLAKAKVKCALQAYEKSLKDKTSANLKVLNKIDKKLSLDKHAIKVKEYHLENHNKILLEEKKSAPEESVFSEKDFERISTFKSIIN